MTIEYRMGVDWDGDGCVCRTARVGDPLNLALTPVTFSDIVFTTAGAGGSSALGTEKLTEVFAVNFWRWTTGTGSSNARITASGALSVPLATVVIGQPYTAVMYVRAISAAAATQPLEVDVRRKTTTIIASSPSFTAPQDVWTRIIVPFIPDVVSIDLVLRRPTSATSVIFDITGFTIFAGTFNAATLPGFNAGTVLSTYENVLPWVMNARWNVGARQPWMNVADKNVCTLTLNNASRLFSPENSSSPLQNKTQDRLMILEAKRTTDTTWTRMYTGFVDSLLPTPGANGPYTAFLEASCSRRYLEGKQVEIDLLVNVRFSDVVRAILDQVNVPNVGDFNLWVIPPAIGAYVWPYAGDNWADGIEPVRAMAEAAAAERGFFFFTRQNRPGIWQRGNRYGPTTSFTHRGTFTDAQEAMDYRYGDMLYNKIEVRRYPRRASTSTTLLLWTLDDEIVLAPLQSETIRARYTNGDEDRTVGGANVTEASFTSSGAINRVITPKAQYAIIAYTNPNASATRTVTAHTLQGRRIRSKDAVTVIRQDNTSIGLYGERPLRLDLRLVAVQADAREIATKELIRYKDPRGRVASMLIGPKDATQEGHIVARTIGDRITVVETQTAHNAQYIICGEEHELTEALKHHKVRWYLEPAIDL